MTTALAPIGSAVPPSTVSVYPSGSGSSPVVLVVISRAPSEGPSASWHEAMIARMSARMN